MKYSVPRPVFDISSLSELLFYNGCLVECPMPVFNAWGFNQASSLRDVLFDRQESFAFWHGQRHLVYDRDLRLFFARKLTMGDRYAIRR